ncbi:MAG: YigZ family protein [Candidatus Kinetoplastibacterium crithidii]|nr:MAG: YigZ family protein [Candidatus Kinetoplastibacterium crithidii]
MKSLVGNCIYECFIKKSRFLTKASYVDSCKEAEFFFEQHFSRTATHNCWAFRVGSIARLNDDKEPSGTAGKSIFDVIEMNNLDRIAILVSRWYGGVKLGSGGLVRAYRFCASECVSTGILVDILNYSSLKCKLEIRYFALLNNRLRQIDYVELLSEEFYGKFVVIKIKIPSNNTNLVTNIVNDITKGSVIWL